MTFSLLDFTGRRLPTVSGQRCQSRSPNPRCRSNSPDSARPSLKADHRRAVRCLSRQGNTRDGNALRQQSRQNLFIKNKASWHISSPPCPDSAYGLASMPFENFTRASDIADFVYCKRAWHLKQRRGARSALTAELARGTMFHERHSRSCAFAGGAGRGMGCSRGAAALPRLVAGGAAMIGVIVLVLAVAALLYGSVCPAASARFRRARSFTRRPARCASMNRWCRIVTS